MVDTTDPLHPRPLPFSSARDVECGLRTRQMLLDAVPGLCLRGHIRWSEDPGRYMSGYAHPLGQERVQEGLEDLVGQVSQAIQREHGGCERCMLE